MTDNLQEEIENKIIDLISLGSGGRLVVFKPENLKTVLTVEKKGDYKSEALVLDILGIERPGGGKLEDKIGQLIGGKNFKAENGLYFLFVYFDAVKQDLEETFWFVPSLKARQLKKGADLSEFLVSKKDFVNFLIGELLKKI